MSQNNPVSNTASSSSNNWRNPSEAHMQKYNLRPLPEDFEPTEEEQLLLDMYDVVRNHERVAKRLKEEEARRKLDQAQSEYQQKMAPKRKKNRRKQKAKAKRDEDDEADSDLDDDDDDDDMDDDDDDEDEEDQDNAVTAKIEQLREEVEDMEAKQAGAAGKEDKLLIDEHLGTNKNEDEDEELGSIIKRQRVVAPPSSSLIKNMTAAVTPPHDFSSKLGLKDKGEVLFPEQVGMHKWEPPEGVFSPNDGAFLKVLSDFNVAKAQSGYGNNTVAIKFMSPADSKRFSINITTEEHRHDFDSVLFHFNPRARERGGQLIVNDKQEGIWGQAIAIPLSQVPLLFGQTSCTLMIQINGEGFDIFVEDKHCARLEHRVELPSESTNLVLQFPSTDDYGKPENWTVYKVWWGNRPIMAQGDVSSVPGVNSYSAVHPRKLFISGLSKIYSDADVDLRRAELERAFRKYGGDRGVVDVIVPTNTTYAFVETESERMADLALQEMADQYRMNRARRSRHEALQEERAAREAGKAGEGKKDGSTWD